MNDNERLERLRAALGPDLLEEVLKVGALVPSKWSDRTAERGFEYLRCRLEFTQQELAEKTGLTQARISKIEGGADALLSTWRRLYRAMGFGLLLLPVSELSADQLRKLAERDRPQGHWLRQRARPRRRWIRRRL